MLIQPQQESEQLLAEELDRRGIRVAWVVALNSLTRNGSAIQTQLLHSNESYEQADYDVIIGADGARSRVREQLGTENQGFRYEETWELYDIELSIPILADKGRVFLYDDGGMIMILLKEDIWRVAGNLKSILQYVPHGSSTGSIL